MMTVVLNETLNAVEILMDEKGIELLIRKMHALKLDRDHMHLYATDDDSGLSVKSPYAHKVVFGELIVGMLPSDAWDDAQASAVDRRGAIV